MFTHIAFAQKNISDICFINGQFISCDKVAQNAKALVGLGALGMFFGLVSIFAVVFWIMMLFHAILNPIKYKILWILALFVFNIFGALAYYFSVKRVFNKTN